MLRRRVLIAGLAWLLLLPAPAVADDWLVDREASSIALSVRAFGGQSSGRFGDWRGVIRFDPSAPEVTRAEVTVQVRSLTLRPAAATGRALGPGFLDAARHPTIRFQLLSLEPLGGDRYTANATITVKGATRPVSFPLALRAQGDRAQMIGGFDIDRAAFGIGTSGPWNRLVGRQVNVQVSLRARRAP